MNRLIIIKINRLLFVIGIMLLMPGIAHADLAAPIIYTLLPVWYIYPIIFISETLAIYYFSRWIFKKEISWKQSILVSLIANLVTSIIGGILPINGYGTDVAYFIIFLFPATVFIEYWVVKSRLFKLGFTRRQTALLTVLFNVVSYIIIAVILLGVLPAGSSKLEKSRDGKRLSDVRQIQTVLEFYFDELNYYPKVTAPLAVGGLCLSSKGFMSHCDAKLETVYMGQIPSNPQPWMEGGCPDQDYTYTSKNNDQDYVLLFCLSQPKGDLSTGLHEASSRNIK
ncbi:MAG: hypothetical protein WC575_01135 [Patescibacteria group bacterium]